MRLPDFASETHRVLACHIGKRIFKVPGDIVAPGARSQLYTVEPVIEISGAPERLGEVTPVSSPSVFGLEV